MLWGLFPPNPRSGRESKAFMAATCGGLAHSRRPPRREVIVFKTTPQDKVKKKRAARPPKKLRWTAHGSQPKVYLEAFVLTFVRASERVTDGRARRGHWGYRRVARPG